MHLSSFRNTKRWAWKFFRGALLVIAILCLLWAGLATFAYFGPQAEIRAAKARLTPENITKIKAYAEHSRASFSGSEERRYGRLPNDPPVPSELNILRPSWCIHRRNELMIGMGGGFLDMTLYLERDPHQPVWHATASEDGQPFPLAGETPARPSPELQ